MPVIEVEGRLGRFDDDEPAGGRLEGGPGLGHEAGIGDEDVGLVEAGDEEPHSVAEAFAAEE